MKFSNLLDIQTFLVEVKAFGKLSEAKEGYVPTKEELATFIKGREPLIKKLKDYSKSSAQKANWRANRTGMMKGIKAFHKSVDGKRFHKRLGKYLATRITRSNESVNEGYYTLLTKQGYLKGLNAAKQHLFVELEYFHQLEAQVAIEEMLSDYAVPYFQSIEKKIINEEELTDDELVFLMDLTDTNSIIQSVSDKTGKEFAEIEKMWKSISDDLIKQGIAKDDEKFYPYLVTELKTQLGIN